MKRSPFWRVLGGVLLVAVLALGFIGYSQPDLQLNWESLAAMCGF
jgi:quinol-cytochrome oxidoreductase complex cytochrome b subunit